MTTDQWLTAMFVLVCLFQASSLCFFSMGAPASLHKVKRDSNHYGGVTFCVQRKVWKLTFNPAVFIVFSPYDGLGVSGGQL